ncbi:hypothetical protein KO493_06640 [Tamlana agarivorans]|uniref:Uncharacterized protein n=1 Tax=Pseudotamlana agarivorans TaxID=481183 RepID=A0ACC5U7R8_9FLAO|nr:VIT domain-containing protein [Tamlana agarivorans]MBU2950368.1 hypothetical protein [Tamlana agarivorans]
MKNLCRFIIIIACSHLTNAQIMNNPMITTSNKNDKPIVLNDLKIDVFVVDNIATTTIEMVFYNNNSSVMEGELNFPLPNGVTVSRFALDVNGEMREGVVVEKEKATQAFEAVVRKNIDPGMVEVTKGNNFKARVYPIPAHGTKKALIAFNQELKNNDQNYIYQLPLNIKYKLKSFHVKAEVVMNKPEVVKSAQPTINLNFTEAQNSYISEYHESDARLNSQLSFSIPKPKKVKKVITYKGKATSNNYFYVNLNLKEEQRTKNKPKNITIVWDESSSGKNRELGKELEILTHYIKWLNHGNITLITFVNTKNTEQTFKIQNGTSPKLINALKAIKYDGGTNINAVDFSKIKTDEILLFTDAISNFGEQQQAAFRAPILALNSSNIANHNLLSHYASASNGSYINAIEISVETVLERLTHQQKQFIKAEYNSEKISEIYPKNGHQITNNFSCSGIIEGAQSELTLHFGFGKEITESHTVLVDNSIRKDNALGERIWAQKKLQNVLVEADNDAIKNHGKKFNLVTPNTSLIVLDDVEDYVQYEIVPPASLQKQYHDLIARRNQKNATNKQNRIEQLCEQFEEDKQWWENAIDYRHVKEALDKKPNEPVIAVYETSPLATPEVFGDVEDEMELEEDAILEEVVVVGYGTRRRNLSNSNKAKKSERPKPSQATLKITAWDSNAPFINELKAVDTPDIYKTYLELKPEYETSPSFYFDVATYMFQKNLRDQGLRVISNLAELELENVEILRTLGRKLAEFKFHKEAIAIFKEVMQTRSFEPHSYIDLGLSYAGNGEYQKAINNLYTVIEKHWDDDIISRFNGIEIITLHDINNIIYHHKKELDTSFINTCFLKPMPVDIRVVIDWDANETDVDLWITDPRNEKCSYSNKETKIGGKISNDITQGYGPEEFRLKHAIDGKYIVEAKFFGSSKQSVIGNITVRAFVYTKFDTKEETKEVLTLQLEPTKGGEYTIGEIEFTK